MSYIREKDRYYIENKYHRTDEAFDPFDRLNYHGYEYDASTGLDDAQMHAALEELFEQNRAALPLFSTMRVSMFRKTTGFSVCTIGRGHSPRLFFPNGTTRFSTPCRI